MPIGYHRVSLDHFRGGHFLEHLESRAWVTVRRQPIDAIRLELLKMLKSMDGRAIIRTMQPNGSLELVKQAGDLSVVEARFAWLLVVSSRILY